VGDKMAHDKIVEMVIRIKKHTESGELVWEQTPTDGLFQLSFPDYTLSILTRPPRIAGEELPDDIIIQIRDDEGRIVEEITDDNLEEGLDNPYIFLYKLYELARRSAMGVDQALDKILGSLPSEPDKDDDIPF
jgi:hypothetical protein